MRQTIVSLLLYLVCISTVHAVQPVRAYRIDGNTITASVDGASRTCMLDEYPRYAMESYDRSALILSERGYIPRELLDNCVHDVPIHMQSIPRGVGVLVDINLREKLYISLDFVNVRPFLYLATVAHIGSKRNLVTLPGAYILGKNLSKLKKQAFSSSGEAGAALISPDGRFVAPAGDIDCTDDAYPGVWDIKKNKRVITDHETCVALFNRVNK